MEMKTSSNCDVSDEVVRPSANFHPSVWGDYFLAYDSNLTEVDILEEEELQQLKEEVKKMLLLAPENSLQKMKLIDAIQRLGLAYHFEKETEASLEYEYDTYNNQCITDEEDGNNDLYSVALRFRLLRQQGYHVSSDVFTKFKDEEGKFNETLKCNLDGILSLYEAAHYRVHGEDILEEALKFTTTHLESIILSDDELKHSSFRVKVKQALTFPINKSLTRLNAKFYISIYEEEDDTNKSLLRFAKLDFNIVQKTHQRELSILTRWWKGLDVETKLPFARDRLVELYFWMCGVYFEPQYSLGRIILTKIIAMLSLIDDTFDAYGTYDELKLFMDAIERWDVSALEKLPSYMQHIYVALLDVYTEIEQEMAKQGKPFIIHYAKLEMKKLVRMYFQEAEWLHKRYIPSFEEYMKVGVVSAAYMILSTSSYIGMGELATKEAFDWVTSEPLMVKASSVFARLRNDMVGHEMEQERGHVASAVECLMNERGLTKEEAYEVIDEYNSNAWKDMNAEWLLRPVPLPLLLPIINLTRAAHLMYKYDEDGYTISKTNLRGFINSMFVQPLVM